MSTISTGASVSLDGYIAGGDVEVPTHHPQMTLRMTPDNAEFQHRLVDRMGAIVVGRHLYDMTHAWGGTHPLGCPVVVLTHVALSVRSDRGCS
jgi:dihydrofolate reductase